MLTIILGPPSPKRILSSLISLENRSIDAPKFDVMQHSDNAIDSPPSLEELELRREEAPGSTPPDFLQDFTTTCEPD